MERRKLSRVVFEIEALVRYKNTYIKTEVKNLSLSGMFVKTDEDFPVGEVVELEISLTGDSSSLLISLEGVVVRTNGEGFGLQYKKVDLDSFIHLKNIVSYNSTEPEKVMEEFHNYVKSSVQAD